MAPALMRRIESLYGVPVVMGYGSAEACHITNNPLPPEARIPGSVGRPFGNEVAVIDSGGNVLAPGETGEVAVSAVGTDHGSRTVLNVGMLICSPVTGEEASEDLPSFSELQARINLLSYYLGRDWELAPLAVPFLLEGRSALIMQEGREVGWIGELSPEVLSLWEIKHPAVAAEIRLWPTGS